jgi:hypothetical protein
MEADLLSETVESVVSYSKKRESDLVWVTGCLKGLCNHYVSVDSQVSIVTLAGWTQMRLLPTPSQLKYILSNDFFVWGGGSINIMYRHFC